MLKNLTITLRTRGTLFTAALLLCVMLMASDGAFAQTGGTPTSTVTTVTKVTPTVSADVCGPQHQAAFSRGREIAIWDRLSKDDQYFKYNVSAAYAANCVNQMIGYVKKLSDTVTAINTLAGSTSVVAAAVTLIATQILEAVLTQILDAINNQVCAITNQVMGALDSVIKNAICLPTINGLGRLDFNVDIDLGRTSCNGWSINPMGIYGAQGIDLGQSRGTTFDAPVIIGSPVSGFGSIQSTNRVYAGGGLTYSSDLPPIFRMDIPVEGGYFDYIEGYDDRPAVAGNIPADNCKNGQTGNFNDFTTALGQRESGGCSNQYTCQTPSGSFRGKYQMGLPLLSDLGYVRCSTPSCKGDNWSTVTWTGKNGVNSTSDYYNKTLNGKNIQETIVVEQNNLTLIYAQRMGLTQYIGQTICGITISKSGLLAATHLVGIGNMQKALTGGNCNIKDGNGIAWWQYANQFSCYAF